MSTAVDDSLPHELLPKLARPGFVPNSTQDDHLHKLSAMVWHFMDNRMRQFLRNHSSMPISISYQSDCTPCATQETFTAETGGKKIRRSGARSGEYLLHRTFARTPDHEQCVLFGPPDYVADKTVMTHAAAARKYLLYPFQFGCQTINITHVVFDGALWEPLTSTLYSDHARALKEHALSNGADYDIMKLFSWFVRTPCVLHSCHNGLKWGLQHELGNNVYMKDVWSCVASLRQTFGSLQPYISTWVGARLVLRERAEDDWPCSLWSAIGIPEKLREELCRLNLRFSEGSLLASAEHKDSATIHADIYAVLLQVFRVFEWSDSRWCGAGRTSRQMLGAIFLGVEDFVDFAIARGHGTYHLTSFGKLDRRMKQFFVQAAIGSYPMDACMDVLFDDDRVPLVLTKLQQEMDEEVESILGMSVDVWQAFGGITGLPALHVRSLVVDVALKSAAYMRHKLQVAHALPWSALCLPLEEAYEEFAHMPRPDDELSFNIWSLIRVGTDRQTVLEGISLLQRLSWSTNPTEQGHSHAARIVRHHRVSATTMQVRSCVGQARPLFAIPADERTLGALFARLRRLEAMQPQKITAKAAFVGDLLDLAAGGIIAEKHDTSTRGKRTVAKHGRLWQALRPEQKRVYEGKAAVRRAARIEEIDDNIAHVRQEIRERIRTADDESAARDVSCRFSSCRLSDSEKRAFDDLWGHPAFTLNRLADIKQIMKQPLWPLTEIEQAALSDADQLAVPQAPPVPAWVKGLARHRDNLRRCLVRVRDGECTRHFKFLFGVLWPSAFVAFLDLAAEVDHEALAALALHCGGSDDWEHAFWFAPGAFCYADSWGEDLPLDPEIHVMEDSAFSSTTRLGSDADWVPWGEFEMRFPVRAARGPRDSRAGAPDRPSRGVLADEPWLQDIFGPVSNGIAIHHGRRAGATEFSEDAGSDSDDQFEQQDVWGALAEARAAVLHGVEDETHFTYTIRGGAWTREHEGVDYDSYRAYAATTAGVQFLVGVGLGTTATFSIDMYTEHGCGVLCRYWVAQMNFFKALADQSEAGAAPFNAVALGRFVEPPEFVELASAVGASRRVQQRIARLRLLRPYM